MSNKPRSLASRLLFASALVLPLFLGFSGYMLNLAFKRSLLAAEQERLNTHIYLLLAAAELQNQTLWLPENLTEPRFSQLSSGLYAFAFDTKGREIWRSPSAKLLEDIRPTDTDIRPGEKYFTKTRLKKTDYYQYDYDIAWESNKGKPLRYRFSLLHSQAEAKAELAAYQKQLGWLLGGLVILLLCTQTFIMHWGLYPLKILSENLRAVEQGEHEQLIGQYPKEIQTVTDNLNRVLISEKNQRERYRNTLADLAHSLKTPLAVMRGGLAEPSEQLPQLIDEQISRMDQIVRHQLQRAVAQNEQQGQQRTQVTTIIERLNQALQKVYAEKKIALSIQHNNPENFNGNEADLMELLGNILENAFKYCKQNIAVTIKQHSHHLHISIADDGPGIPKNLQHTILQRGARADTAQPGHGIGLAIAVDIISSYKGSLEVGTSSLGGASFEMILPLLN